MPRTKRICRDCDRLYLPYEADTGTCLGCWEEARGTIPVHYYADNETLFKDMMRARAKDACEWCGARDAPLEIHHIMRGANRSLTLTFPGGVLALCDECHDDIHDEPKSYQLWVLKRNREQDFDLPKLRALCMLNGKGAIATEAEVNDWQPETGG